MKNNRKPISFDQTDFKNIFPTNSNKIIPSLALMLLSAATLHGQDVHLSGTVRTMDGGAIPHATVKINNTKNLQADAFGRFVSVLPAGSHRFQFTATGYQMLDTLVTIQPNDTLDILPVLRSNTRINEVIVSASRRVESLDEVPSSVTVLSQKQLESQRSISNNLSDILAATVPGLGFSTNRTQNLGQTLRGRRVLIMIDGIPQSTPLRDGARDIRSLDPSVIERVEVIKGATAIYGNGADGGLINYITKHADPDRAFAGTTEIGSNFSLVKPGQTGGYNVSQLFNGRQGHWDYVLSGRYEKTGLYKDAEGVVLSPEYGMNDLKNWNAFAKVGYRIDAKNRLELMYNFFKSTQYTDYIAKAGKYGDFNAPTTGVIGKRPGQPEGTPYNHNASLKYAAQELLGKTDFDANIYFQDYETLINYSNFFEGNGQPGTRSKKLGLRLNFNSPLSWSNDISSEITYGLDLLSDKTNTTLTDGRTVIPNMDMRNLAPYFQLKTNFGKDLILKAGSRLENVHINVPTFTTLGILNAVNGNYVGGGVVVNGGDLNFTALMLNAGLRYTNIQFFKPFVSFSQSFSVADLGLVLRAAKENTVTNTSIKAVKANNYEFGFSGDIGRFSYEAATYYSTSTLGASYVFVDGNPQIARSPEKIYGFELSANYRVHPILDIGASYSYTEGKRELADGSKAYLGGDRINPPKITASVTVNPISKWSLTTQMIATSGRNRFEPVNGLYSYGTGPIHSFTTFNFSSKYQFHRRAILRVGIENLLNKDYYTVISQWQSNHMNYVKGNGTRINMSLAYSF
ncbi:TonB-dependent receptor [Sphingobacterium sp. HMA12]|uniref:TonB-dependent receptor n=1 Tax=Sphingobacterium sp. HMA12 TaxID=2050894 RepID=UPI000CE9EECA|nr:TonB-dependent receptor [Sphingobacterium sp. HMA12]